MQMGRLAAQGLVGLATGPDSAAIVEVMQSPSTTDYPPTPQSNHSDQAHSPMR